MESGQNGELMGNAISPADGERNTDIGNAITLRNDMVAAPALDVPISMHLAK